MSWAKALQPDKIAHLGVYAILFILLWNSICKELLFKSLKPYNLAVCFGFGICLGLSLEILQAYLATGRYFDIFDFLANDIGLVLGYIFVRIQQKKR
jgi:glycopeptide antibiotics resistance protein